MHLAMWTMLTRGITYVDPGGDLYTRTPAATPSTPRTAPSPNSESSATT